jgi:hypothetical protein
MYREKPLLLLVFRGIICAQVPPPKRAYDNFARDLAGVRFCVQN